MNNKVLVKLFIPEIDQSFDIFLPINEIIWKIKLLIIKSVSDLTGITFDDTKDFVLINKNSSKIYKNNEFIINTDIRNACELVLIRPAAQK